MELAPETQEAFETFVEEALGTAWYFVDQDPRVTRIWVYVGMRDQAATSDFAYEVEGKVCRIDEVHQALGKTPPQGDDLYQPHVDATEAASDLEQVWRSDPAEQPHRIIISYDTQAEEMEAEFSYESPRDEPIGHIMNAWFDRLASTGNDSPDI